MTPRERVALVRLALGMRQSAFVVRIPEAPLDPAAEAFIAECERERLSPRGRGAEDRRYMEGVHRQSLTGRSAT